MEHHTRQPDSTGTPSRATVRWISADTLELDQEGYLSEPLVESLFQDLQNKTRGRTVTWALSEASRVTGFDPAIVGPGGKILDELKRLGARKLVIVAPSALLRVLASALGLASGLSIKMVASRAEAEHYIEHARR